MENLTLSVPQSAALSVAVGAVLLTAYFLSTKKTAKFKVKNTNWTKDHVYVYMYGSFKGSKLPSASPSCIKLALFLKYSGIPHTVIESIDSGPTGKMPYIELNGEAFGESAHIIDRLCTMFPQANIDEGLSETDRAISYAIQALVEDQLYFLELHQRWGINKNFAVLVKELFSSIPWPIRGVISSNIQRAVIRDLHGQGMGRLTDEIRDWKLTRILETLSAFLDQGPFLLGDSVRVVDFVAYAQLASIMDASRVGSNIPSRVKDFPNLVEYLSRCDEEFL